MDNQPANCPFCGAEAKLIQIAGAFRVLDTNPCCGVFPSTDWHKTAEAAINAWNRRTQGVVTCGSCRYGLRNAYQCNLVLCRNESSMKNKLLEDTDFCSFGARKEQDT